MAATDSSAQVSCRLRCLNDCADALVNGKSLPSCIGFVPEVVEYKPKEAFALSVHAKPHRTSRKTEVPCTTKHRLFLDVDHEQQNEEERWVKIKRIEEDGVSVDLDPAFQWVILSDNELTKAEDTKHTDGFNYWKDFVDHVYARNLGEKKENVVEPTDKNSELLAVPKDWSLEHDEALMKLFANESSEWKVTDYVESLESSANNDEVTLILRDNESMGWGSYNADEYLLLIEMKKNTVVRSLSIRFFYIEDDDLPDPCTVTAYGGEKGSEELLGKCDLKSSKDFVVTLFSGQPKHFPFLKLEFVGKNVCFTTFDFDGLINGREEHKFFTEDIFALKFAEAEPLLASFDQNFLRKRLTALQRVADLLDSVLTHIVPVWEQSLGSFSHKKIFQKLLPLSKKKNLLVKQVLDQTQIVERSYEEPVVYLNRNCMNSEKLDAVDTVFNQIYEGLVQEEANRSKDTKFTYREWSREWWKCGFIGEEIVDHAGVFRDTMSSIAEELCPKEVGSRIVLPFFVPCGNLQNPMASNYKDTYVPNPSCREFQKYEWIGKLMGACLRGDNLLTISLSPFFWKLLTETEVTWLDYTSVDEAQVKAVNDLEKMDEATYSNYYGETRTWTVVLSDGTSVPLKPNGDQLLVSYAERLVYAELVKEARMNESKLQVEAIRSGLLQVVPKVLLWLLSPDELEVKICGFPEVTFENLKKHVIIQDIRVKHSQSLQYLWKVLEGFTSNERSQFLRFTTGGRHLPSEVYVAPTSATDKLPTAAHCGHQFYLPTYTSFEIADKLIRLAISSCDFIDCDFYAPVRPIGLEYMYL